MQCKIDQCPPLGSSHRCQSIEQEDVLIKVEVGMADEQGSGTCHLEELLQETVDRLISALGTDRRKDKQSGETFIFK